MLANFTLMWCTSEQNQSCQKKQRVAHSKPQLGSYFKSTSLCPAESGEIGPMFTALPLKLAFRRKCEDRDASSNGIAVSLGGSRYRDETRVEKWTITQSTFWEKWTLSLHHPTFVKNELLHHQNFVRCLLPCLRDMVFSQHKPGKFPIAHRIGGRVFGIFTYRKTININEKYR